MALGVELRGASLGSGFISPEFRGEGQAGDRNVGGISWLGHSFPNYFIPGKGPVPSSPLPGVR